MSDHEIAGYVVAEETGITSGLYINSQFIQASHGAALDDCGQQNRDALAAGAPVVFKVFELHELHEVSE